MAVVVAVVAALRVATAEIMAAEVTEEAMEVTEEAMAEQAFPLLSFRTNVL